MIHNQRQLKVLIHGQANTDRHLFLRGFKVLSQLRLQRNDAALLDIFGPVNQQLVHLLRILFREVVDLARIFAEIVELPGLGPLGFGDEDCFPLTGADGGTAAELPTLDEIFAVDTLLLSLSRFSSWHTAYRVIHIVPRAMTACSFHAWAR